MPKLIDEYYVARSLHGDLYALTYYDKREPSGVTNINAATRFDSKQKLFDALFGHANQWRPVRVRIRLLKW